MAPYSETIVITVNSNEMKIKHIGVHRTLTEEDKD